MHTPEAAEKCQKYKFIFCYANEVWIYFQRVKVPYAWGEIAEALASRKVAGREAYTEGSETAKSGTDEQKRDMRHGWTGEQARLCDAQRLQKSNYVDSAGIG